MEPTGCGEARSQLTRMGTVSSKHHRERARSCSRDRYSQSLDHRYARHVGCERPSKANDSATLSRAQGSRDRRPGVISKGRENRIGPFRVFDGDLLGISRRPFQPLTFNQLIEDSPSHGEFFALRLVLASLGICERIQAQ